MEWFDALGSHRRGIGKYKDLVSQACADAEFIIASRDDSAEEDIDALLKELGGRSKAK
jgi:hypothetical protein